MDWFVWNDKHRNKFRLTQCIHYAITGKGQQIKVPLWTKRVEIGQIYYWPLIWSHIWPWKTMSIPRTLKLSEHTIFTMLLHLQFHFQFHFQFSFEFVQSLREHCLPWRSTGYIHNYFSVWCVSKMGQISFRPYHLARLILSLKCQFKICHLSYICHSNF